LALNVVYFPKGLMRIRETCSQVGLNRQERRKNVQDVFLAHPGVKENMILLVDDVSTTGSTLSSCAQALRRSGAGNVYAVTVARALFRHGLPQA